MENLLLLDLLNWDSTDKTVRWDSGRGYHGNPRSMAIGYSGGNYGQFGYGINFTTTSGQHTYAINDIATRCDLYDGLQVYTSVSGGTVGSTISWTELMTLRNGEFSYKQNTIWHAGNDGGSSGLDADLLDGQHGSHYLNAGNLTGSVDIDRLPTKDEDNMSSNSASHVPTQQSVKAYVDSQSGGAVSAVANGSNNRIATFSSSDALNGESNLTFNGTTLAITGSLTASGNATISGNASVTSSITTNYGVAFTNGNTNFLLYNNTGDNIFYLRDTTNGQMLQTWTTSTTTINKNLLVDGGLLTVDDGGDANEGGEIAINPGTSHSCVWRIDSFHGHLRFFGSTTSGEQMALTHDGNLSILTGTKFSLDGRGGHTYIQEESDGNVVFYADNRQMLRLHEGNGEVVINDPQLNTDFRVESDGRDKMLFVDASADIVAINGSGLGGRFNITESTGSGNPIAMRIRGYDHAYILSTQNSSATGNPEQFRIEHYDGNVRMNSLRGSLAINEESGQNVGINTSSPSYKLDVAGDIRAQNGYQYYGDSTSGVLSTGSWAGDLVSGQSYERVCGLSHDGGEFVIGAKGGRVGTLIDGSYFAYEAGSGEGGGFYSSSNSSYGGAYGFEASGGSVVFQAADESWSNPVLELRNTATSTGSGPSLTFGHSQSGTNSVARISSYLVDGSQSGRAGHLRFWTRRAGTEELAMQLQNDKKLRLYQAGDTTDYLEIFVDDSRANPYHHAHTGTSGAYHRFITDNGYMELGPSNTGWGHIQTDRASFILTKDLRLTKVLFNLMTKI